MTKTTLVNVPIISAIRLDSDCEKIIDKLGKRQKSLFIREAIMSHAKRWGFKVPDNRPDYFHPEKWTELQEAQEKSRRVDYSYVIAYHWLKARFSYLKKSEIIREAIKSYQPGD